MKFKKSGIWLLFYKFVYLGVTLFDRSVFDIILTQLIKLRLLSDITIWCLGSIVVNSLASRRCDLSVWSSGPAQWLYARLVSLSDKWLSSGYSGFLPHQQFSKSFLYDFKLNSTMILVFLFCLFRFWLLWHFEINEWIRS